jgi:hypothetical protein
MANKKDIMKKLNERKVILVEILEEYNKYFIEIADKLMEGRYAGLGMVMIQAQSEDDPLCYHGCYSALENVEKTKRLVDVLHKKDVIEGHENDWRVSHGSYKGLANSISRIYARDVEDELNNIKDFHELVRKFDDCGFTPAEVKVLSHLLFFEQISLVPKTFTGHRPSYYMLLKSFFSTIDHYEFSINHKSQPHSAFNDIGFLFQTDVDLEGLYGE